MFQPSCVQHVLTCATCPKALQIRKYKVVVHRNKEQIRKWWQVEEAGGEGGRRRRRQAEKVAGGEGGRRRKQVKKEAGEGGRWRRRQAEKEAGKEGGRQRRRLAEEEAGLSLLTTAIKTNEELITRMENNLKQVKNEPQNKLRNPSLGDTDKQLCTLFAYKTLEQLELNTEARVAEREKRKTPTLTPTGSSKDHTNNGTTKGRAKERTTRNTPNSN